MKGHQLAIDSFHVWLAGYQPATIPSASNLASFQGVCSGLCVEVHQSSVNCFCVRVEGNDSFTVTAFRASHIDLLSLTYKNSNLLLAQNQYIYG